MSEHHSSNNDGIFIDEAKRMLDDSLRRIDAKLAGRLQRARLDALATARGSRWLGWKRGLAAASVALVVLIFFVSRPELDHQFQPMLEDLDVMTSTENAELSEDLEFYDWLADNAAAG
jgi:hypothetical protein